MSCSSAVSGRASKKGSEVRSRPLAASPDGESSLLSIVEAEVSDCGPEELSLLSTGAKYWKLTGVETPNAPAGGMLRAIAVTSPEAQIGSGDDEQTSTPRFAESMLAERNFTCVEAD